MPKSDTKFKVGHKSTGGRPPGVENLLTKTKNQISDELVNQWYAMHSTDRGTIIRVAITQAKAGKPALLLGLMPYIAMPQAKRVDVRIGVTLVDEWEKISKAIEENGEIIDIDPEVFKDPALPKPETPS